MPRMAPCGTSKLTSRTALKPPNDFDRLRTLSAIGAPATGGTRAGKVAAGVSAAGAAVAAGAAGRRRKRSRTFQ